MKCDENHNLQAIEFDLARAIFYCCGNLHKGNKYIDLDCTNEMIFQCLLFLTLNRKQIVLKYKSYHKCSGIIDKYFYP